MNENVVRSWIILSKDLDWECIWLNTKNKEWCNTNYDDHCAVEENLDNKDYTSVNYNL